MFNMNLVVKSDQYSRCITAITACSGYSDSYY